LRVGRDGYAVARRRLVDRLAKAGVRDPRVLAAFSEIPRHLFVPDALRERAYGDRALPIGDGQTISAPEMVARMSEALALQGRETVLEIGTGSAFQAAVLGRLAGRVISLERLPRLAASARRALDQCGASNVLVYLADGTRGWPEAAPFDAIAVTAGGPTVPLPLLAQLSIDGRLVGPFGPRGAQQLVRVRRVSESEYTREALGPCRFVDLVGQHGWLT
jgi:protein-L-isoaspartate(D-aspartate) O-methyltransferase